MFVEDEVLSLALVFVLRVFSYCRRYIPDVKGGIIKGKERTYVVKSARILRGNIQLSAQRTKRPSVQAVTMRRAEHIRTRSVDGRVDHERRRVEQSARSAVDDFAVVVDEDQVGGFD